MTLSGNKAGSARWLNDETDRRLHESNIVGITVFSAPPEGKRSFSYAYNNYDIMYTKGYDDYPEEGLKFTVTFIGYDGETVLDTQQVLEKTAATAPQTPRIPGMAYLKWDKDFSYITGDLTVYAEYEPIYQAFFTDDGSARVHNGTDAPIEGSCVIAVYSLDGRMKEMESVPFIAAVDGDGAIVDIDFELDIRDYPADAYTVRVFFWDKTFVPLSDLFSRS
jgi:hypothetical protein